MVRKSNIELLRMVSMFLIVLHHYCVNSGFMEVMDLSHVTPNTLLVQFMSFGGKVGVNVFLIISGYFMIRGGVKWIKVLKLLLQILFYNVVVFACLALAGVPYGWKEIVRICPVLFSLPGSFIGSYLLVYMLSSVLNKWLTGLSRKEYRWLLAVLLFYFVVAGTFLKQDTWNYFGWAFTLYIVGGYLRLHYDGSLERRWPGFWPLMSLLSLGMMWGFMLLVDYFLYPRSGISGWTYLMADANKFPVFLMGVSLFLWFRSIPMGYHRWINTLAASSFGVLLIHANSGMMRQWLWKDFLHNTSYYDSPYLWLHMLLSVVGVYLICSLLDILRIRFLEEPLFRRWS